jgi:hypothetical protein
MNAESRGLRRSESSWERAELLNQGDSESDRTASWMLRCSFLAVDATKFSPHADGLLWYCNLRDQDEVERGGGFRVSRLDQLM